MNKKYFLSIIIFFTALLACSDDPQKITAPVSNVTEPQIVIKRSGTRIYSGSASCHFSSVVIGQTSNTVPFTIENTGGVDLDINSIEISGANADEFSHSATYPAAIASNSSMDFNLSFSPTSTGIKTATLSIDNNDTDESPFTISLDGLGVTTVADINVKDSYKNNLLSGSGILHFGSVEEGVSTSPVTITIESLGDADLDIDTNDDTTPDITISGTDAAMFSLDTTSTSNDISPNDTTTFTITYSPTVADYHTATVTILSNDPDEASYDFTISGNATPTPEPEINVIAGVTPDTANVLNGGEYDGFADTSVASGTSTVTFTIQNLGDATLTLSGSPIVDITVSDFTVTSQPAASIGANSSETFTIEFDPSSAGTLTATVTIQSDDNDENPYTFDIYGVGIGAPEINLQDSGSNNITDGGSYAAGFGNVPVGTTGSVHYFTIQNTGNAVLNITSVESDNPSEFSIVGNPSSTISSGSSSTFSMTFTPSTSSPPDRTANITIVNDDSDENPYNFTVSGTGAVPEINIFEPGPTNIPDGGAYSGFGIVNVGASSAATSFNIENTGGAVLNIASITISGTNASEFNLDTSLTDMILTESGGGNDTTTFDITFSPTSSGVKTATVVIVNDDGDEGNYTFTISGTGTGVNEINIKQESDIADGGAYDFGNVAVGSSSPAVVFTIENLGNADLTLSGTPKVAIAGADSADFSISQPSSPIVAGDSTYFTIVYTPSSTGAPTADISIINDDGDENPYNITLNGNGTGLPEMNVKQESDIADGGAYDFGNVAVGSSSPAVVFTIENLGNIDLTLSGTPKVAIAGADSADFSISQPSSPIVAGDSTYFTIVYTPSSTGAPTADISIINDDGDENPYNITLNGNGLINNVVDSSNDVGEHTSIAVNGTDIYIAYYDYANGELKFASSDDSGSTWSRKTLEDVGDYAAIEMNISIAIVDRATDTIYISYYDANNTDLMLQKSTDAGSTWLATATTVDNSADVGKYCSIAVIDGGGGETTDEVYISYYDDTTDDLKFAYSNDGASSWASVTIDSVGNVGQYTSIEAVSDARTDSDPEDDIYICYYDVTNTQLKYAEFIDDAVGGNGYALDADWITASVDNTADMGQYSSLAVIFDAANPAQDKLYISYYDATGFDLEFAYSTDGGGTWASVTIDSSVATIGQYTSISAVDATGRGGDTTEDDIYITYYDATTPQLKYAEFIDDTNANGYNIDDWTITAVDNSADVGQFSSLAVIFHATTPGSDELYISYYDDTNTHLKMAKSTDGGATWE
ncbi:MAG: choice-of-anchor D domain-containing protein [Spirochaetota bacterium]|nr:choice-of-anchor D domain-containing protein [Spirochaetota bacterium]